MANRFLWAVFIAGLAGLVAISGCKGKVETAPEMVVATEEMGMEVAGGPGVEIATTYPTETIPPTAAPQVPARPAAPTDQLQKNIQIQTALKNAGFYSGAIDGKLGPKSKKAIVEFQKAKGLKADGKVGPRTWAELDKYLLSQ